MRTWPARVQIGIVVTAALAALAAASGCGGDTAIAGDAASGDDDASGDGGGVDAPVSIGDVDGAVGGPADAATEPEADAAVSVPPDCTTAGATWCLEGATRRCEFDSNGDLRWTAPVACASAACLDATACDPCLHHECAAIDLACSVDDLTACVWDDVCRVEVTATCALGCAGAAEPAACATCPEVAGPVIAQLPLLNPIDVELVGQHAVIADGGFGLRVVDVHDLARPRLIASATLPDVGGIDVDRSLGAGHAFLASPSEGLVAYDLADLARPARRGSFATTAADVVVAGGIAYVAASRAGLVIVDVHDPEHPIELGRIPVGSTERLDTVQLDGGRVYAGGGALIVVVDVADPRHPALLGRTEAGGGVVDLELLGDRTYASVQSGNRHSLEVFDLRDPAQPRTLASRFVYGAGDMAVVGTTIYLPAGGKVDILDAADPDALVWRGAAPGVAGVRAVVVDRDHALLADGSGLLTVPLTRARWADVTIGELDIGNDILDLVVEGPFVHVAASRQGLIIVDASRPEAPVEVGRFRPPGAVTDLEVRDGLAYLLVDDELQIVDVRAPAMPIRLGRLQLFGDDLATGMALAGDRVYVATRSNQVSIIDVHDPAAPVGVAGATTEHAIRSLAVAGRYLHVLHVDRFTIVDLEAAGGPAVVGSLLLADRHCEDVVTDGAGTVYAACGIFVHVIDVRTPSAPAVRGTANPPFRERRIVRDGKRLYVAAAEAGVSVIDVESPSFPVITDRFPTTEPARAIGLLGNVAVIAIGPGYADRLTFRAMCEAP